MACKFIGCILDRLPFVIFLHCIPCNGNVFQIHDLCTSIDNPGINKETTVPFNNCLNLWNNGQATPERKANAKAMSRHWVLILTSLPATPE